MPPRTLCRRRARGHWAKLFEEHLPQRYQVITKCKVADHLGRTSDEIDIAICDRQYSTLVVKAESRQRVPAEAVYAVLEVKPRVNRDRVLYAADKVESVRGLARTSAPIVHADGRIDEFARERTKLYRREFTADHLNGTT